VSSWLLGATGLSTSAQITATQLRIQTALAGQPIPIGYGQNRLAGNLIWYGDFSNKATGAGGKGGIFGSGSPKYSASSIVAFCEGPISAVIGVYDSNGVPSTGKGGKGSKGTILPNAEGEVPLSALGYALATGTYTQGPWGYIQSKYPAQALAYRGTCYIYQANQQLGSSPELPSINLEVQFATNSAAAPVGAPDANPRDVIVDLLTNAHYGVPGWPAGIIGDTANQVGIGLNQQVGLQTYWHYCQANGLWVSPILVDQQAAASFLSNLLRATNSEGFFSQGLLQIVPYGDQAITANGGTYTPPVAPIYALTDIDFIAKDPDQTIKITRLDVTQKFNDIRVCYLDRTFEYNPSVPMEAMDDAAIAQYGRRPNQIEQFDFFCLASAAQMCAQLMLQRQKIVTTFEFTLGAQFILLDPMDIVSLTCAQQGLNNQWVRIKEITENSDFTLTMKAEIYLDGTGAAPIYSQTLPLGPAPDWSVLPGNINPPIIFEPTINLSNAQEIWAAVSGSPVTWGGCTVWVSTDNATYAQVPGQIVGPARMGILATPLPTIAGGQNTIDTSNTLAVNLTESAGQLTSGSQADAQALATLCYVDGEFIAYANASAYGVSKYNLTYLVRGAYGTSGVMNSTEHLAGAAFARLDSAIFQIPYNQNQIGQTLYIKFLSFNLVGQQLQSLAEVEPYTYTVIGLAAGITTLQDFAATGETITGAGGGQIPAIQVTWTPIENAAITSVLVEYYVSGGNPNQATQVSFSPEAGIGLITAGIQGGTTYELLGTIVTAPNDILPSTWTGPIAVTTPNTYIPSAGAPPNVPTGLTLANTAFVNADGSVIAGVAAIWNSDASDPAFSYYQVEITLDGGSTWTSVNTGNNHYQWNGLQVGLEVYVNVATVSRLGAVSSNSTTVGIIVTGQASAPNAPVYLTATPGFQTVFLQWGNPTNPDFDYINIYQSTTDNLASASWIGSTSASSFSVTGLTPNTTYYYWVQAVNTSGIAGNFNAPATSGTAATTHQVGTTDITPNAITTPLLAAGAVVADTIGAGQVTAAAMAANSITAGNAALAVASVGTANIQNLAVGTLQIAGNSVTIPQYAQGGAVAGNSAYQNVLSSTLTITAPAGDSVNIEATAIIQQTYLGRGPTATEMFVQVYDSASNPTIASASFSGNDAAPDVAIAGVYTFTATGSPQSFDFVIWWNGLTTYSQLTKSSLLLLAVMR
jgi:hypothetical protein